MRTMVLRIVQCLLLLGAALILAGGLYTIDLAALPLYGTFLALSLPLAFAYVVAASQRLPVPLPSLATSIAFTYLGGLPVVALTLLEPAWQWLAYRVLRALWPAWSRHEPFYRVLGREILGWGRILAVVVFSWGLGIRWLVFHSLAPATAGERFLSMAISEGLGFALWTGAAFLPIYGGRPLIAGAQVIVWDLMLLASVTVLPAVYLMVMSYQQLGLLGASVWALATLGMHAAVRQMNDRREIVEAQNRQLEAMNRELKRTERLSTIGRMSSVISHQLLHQLGIIGLSADLIRTVDLAGGSDAHSDCIRERVDQIEHALGEANRVMADLLVFSKDRRLTRCDTNLTALLEECTRGLQVAALRAGVRVEVQGAENCRAAVDRLKLRQVIGNILQNAIEASPPGATVRVELVPPRDGADAVRIRLSDRGSGVPSDAAERIFVPFFTTKERGIGLGLAIARELVEAHGGAITVEPGADGIGATFTIHIPRTATTSTASQTAAGQNDVGSDSDVEAGTESLSEHIGPGSR